MGAKASFLLACTMLWWSFGINANPPRADVATVQSIISSIQASAALRGKSTLQ